ncbi:MAG: molybdopterin-dependent oxidoreductase, partial [Rhodospirillaceae bacterium]
MAVADLSAAKSNAPISVCPHDCPSACQVSVDLSPEGKIARLHGGRKNTYTDGVLCAKVARYAERVHHPDRLMTPLKRTGAKGDKSGFVPIGWDEALDQIAEAFIAAEARLGPESVWPYFYAGTMGLVQRESIQRLRLAKGYSRQGNTICTGFADAGWVAGVGAKVGVDSREMAESDLIVVWGCNAVHTQVQAMSWIAKARKERGAKLVVVDPYRNATALKADQHLMLRPGTDGALACAVMAVLFEEGLADDAYMARFTDNPAGLRAHVRSRGPDWAAPITGLSPEEIRSFARLYGRTQRSYIRVGYGFSRQRNGSAALHAVSCLPA